MSNSNFWKSQANIKEYRGENAWVERSLADGTIDEIDLLCGYVVVGMTIMGGILGWFLGSLMGYWETWIFLILGAAIGGYLGIRFSHLIFGMLLVSAVLAVIVSVGYFLWQGYEGHLENESLKQSAISSSDIAESTPTLKSEHGMTTTQTDMPISLRGTLKWQKVDHLHKPTLVLNQSINVEYNHYHMGEIETTVVSVDKVILFSELDQIDSELNKPPGTNFVVNGTIMGSNAKKTYGLQFVSGNIFSIDSMTAL